MRRGQPRQISVGHSLETELDGLKEKMDLTSEQSIAGSMKVRPAAVMGEVVSM